MAKLETRVMRLLVVPEGDQIFSEMATSVEIDDEASGEFVIVKQPKPGEVKINPEEWPAIRKAIDRLIKECRNAR